jgi:hypothetical protein
MSINYRKFHITKKIFDNNKNLSFNYLYLQHKQIEKRDNIISYIGKPERPKVRDDYKCDNDKPLAKNKELQSNFEILLNTRATYQLKLQNENINTYKIDKGHKYLINAYHNKKKNCNKIIIDQEKLLPKQKKKKRKRFKKKKSSVIQKTELGNSKTELNELKDLNELNKLNELKELLSKLKIN